MTFLAVPFNLMVTALLRAALPRGLCSWVSVPALSSHLGRHRAVSTLLFLAWGLPKTLPTPPCLSNHAQSN